MALLVAARADCRRSRAVANIVQLGPIRRGPVTVQAEQVPIPRWAEMAL